jgi:hypothetical protein
VNYDVTISNGFSTINQTFLPSSQSGRLPNGNWLKFFGMPIHISPTPRGPEFRQISIYAVHELGELPAPGDKVGQPPARAKIGTILTLIPSKQQFQYQWNGQFYDWVPVE